MDDVLFSRWKLAVDRDDTVVLVGDVSFWPLRGAWLERISSCTHLPGHPDPLRTVDGFREWPESVRSSVAVRCRNSSTLRLSALSARRLVELRLDALRVAVHRVEVSGLLVFIASNCWAMLAFVAPNGALQDSAELPGRADTPRMPTTSVAAATAHTTSRTTPSLSIGPILL